MNASKFLFSVQVPADVSGQSAWYLSVLAGLREFLTSRQSQHLDQFPWKENSGHVVRKRHWRGDLTDEVDKIAS